MIDHANRTALVVETADHGLRAILSQLGVRVLSARHAEEAISAAQAHIVDFAFADIILPGAEGDALLRLLRRVRSDVHPGCALTCLRGFPVPETEFVILTRPCSLTDIRQTLDRLLPENQPLPPALCERIGRLLDDLGIPAHPGRAHLIRAVGITLIDSRLSGQLSRRLYPALSNESGAAPAQVERAIRHCIDTAWRTGSVEEQYRIFGSTIDAQRGKPTIAQMIARCADILRLEGSP